MLVNVTSDTEFQRYLDRVEQSMFVEMSGAMRATIRIHVNRNGLQAETYLTKRGGDILNHYYQRIYRDQFRAVTKAEAKSITSDFMTDQLAYLALRAGRRIVGIAEDLRMEISSLIMDGIREGKPNKTIAREIEKLSPQISKRRSAVIARTETHQSSINAIDASLAHKNIKVQTKTWWSAGDDRVRPTHREAHGQTVDYVDAFNVGGSQLKFPGDQSLGAPGEEVINCRCSVLFNTGAAPDVVDPQQSNASELYQPPTKTPEEIIAAHGAGEAVAAVRARLETAVPTDAPVEKGGFMRPDGSYTLQRQELHRKLVGEIINEASITRATPSPGEAPLLTVLGGRGGSGKSWLTGKDGPIDPSKSILLDSDYIKSKLPGYAGWNAAQYHEESKHIISIIDDKARSLGLNVIHDATMKSTDSAKTIVENYDERGYKIEGYYMYLSPDKAADRALSRYAQGGKFDGRFVPPEVVLGNTKNEKNFDDLSTKFSNWAIYDNSGSSPRLIEKKRR